MATHVSWACRLIAIAMLIAAACPSASAQCRPQWLPGAAAPDYPPLPVTGVEFDDGQGPLLYCGGEFAAIGNQLVHGLARWTGTRWEPVPGWPGGRVHRVDVVEGALWVARTRGDRGAEQSDIQRWDGVTWSSVAPPTEGVISGFAKLGSQVFVLASDGQLHDYLYRWDGVSWQAAQDGLPADSTPWGLKSFDGQVFLGQSTWEQSSHVVMRWNDAEGQWRPSATPALGGDAWGLAAFQGELIASGHFADASVVQSPSIAAVMRYRNGTWEPLGTGLKISSGQFYITPNMLSASGGRLYAAGNMELRTPDWPEHLPPRKVALVVWDGTAWTAIDRNECGFHNDFAWFAFMTATRDGPAVSMYMDCPTYLPAIHQSGSWRNLMPANAVIQRFSPSSVRSVRGELFGLFQDLSTSYMNVVLRRTATGWQPLAPSPSQGSVQDLIAARRRIVTRINWTAACNILPGSNPSVLVEWMGSDWQVVGDDADCPRVQVVDAAAVGDDLYVIGCVSQPSPAPEQCGLYRQRADEDYERVGDVDNLTQLLAIGASEGAPGPILGVGNEGWPSHSKVLRLWTGGDWVNLGSPLPEIQSVTGAAWHNGELLVSLTRDSRSTRSSLIRWNGSAWADWPVPVGPLAFDVLSVRGRLVVRTADDGVIEWDGAAWRLLADTPPYSVSKVLVHRGELAVTGSFDVVGDVISNGVAVQGCTCPGDFDDSGGRGVEDVLAYLTAWFDRQSAADSDASGAVGLQDLFDFLNGWFGACL